MAGLQKISPTTQRVFQQVRKLLVQSISRFHKLTRSRVDHQNAQRVNRSAFSSYLNQHTKTGADRVTPDHILRSPEHVINIPRNVPFHQYMFEKCHLYKDRLAEEDFLTGRKYTYSQVKEKSIKVASALHRLGYRKNDVIMAFTSNHIDFTVLMLACAANGIWFTAANPTFTPVELSRQLHHSDSKAVFTIPHLAGTVKAALQNKEFPNKVKKLFVFGEAPGFQPFQTLLDDDGKAFPDVDINPVEDVFILSYSSGTTGLPKGVMQTHYNCMANCFQAETSFQATPHDHIIGVLPLYHVYGMLCVQFSVLHAGSSITFLPKFEPELFLRCLQDKQITLAHMVPPLLVFLAKHPLVTGFNLTSLKKVFSGAAPLGVELTDEFHRRLNHGVQVNQVYGLTETCGVTNVDTTGTPASIGTLVTGTLGKIIDLKTNKNLGPGESGEFCVKGPQVMKGYYNNKQATDDMITPDGWLHTGDIGYYTRDCLVFIKDRLKELIKYKGSQMSCRPRISSPIYKRMLSKVNKVNTYHIHFVTGCTGRTGSFTSRTLRDSRCCCYRSTRRKFRRTAKSFCSEETQIKSH